MLTDRDGQGYMGSWNPLEAEEGLDHVKSPNTILHKSPLPAIFTSKSSQARTKFPSWGNRGPRKKPKQNGREWIPEWLKK